MSFLLALQVPSERMELVRAEGRSEAVVLVWAPPKKG